MMLQTKLDELRWLVEGRVVECSDCMGGFIAGPRDCVGNPAQVPCPNCGSMGKIPDSTYGPLLRAVRGTWDDSKQVTKNEGADRYFTRSWVGMSRGALRGALKDALYHVAYAIADRDSVAAPEHQRIVATIRKLTELESYTVSEDPDVVDAAALDAVIEAVRGE